jgi:hypothetical protein
LVPEEGARSRLETGPGTVEPDAVFPVHEVVAHVEVGPPVAIQVAEHHAQAPVGGGRLQFATVLVEEGAFGPGNRGEVAAAAIEVEEVPLSPFQDLGAAVPFAHRDEPVFRCDTDGSVGFPASLDPQSGRMILEGGGPIIRDVQIEIAIAIDVGQRQRGGSEPFREPVTGGFGEVSGSVIQEQSRAHADPVDQQIEIPVAIDVGQHRARARLVGTGGTAPLGLALETPATAVEVQCVGSLEPREIQVAQPVSIDIPEGHPGAVLQDPVVGHRGFAHRVGHGNPRDRRPRGHRQRADSPSGNLAPHRFRSPGLGQNGHSKGPACDEEPRKPAHGE